MIDNWDDHHGMWERAGTTAQEILDQIQKPRKPEQQETPEQAYDRAMGVV